MATFSVIRIIDGDTFEVTPNWKWQAQTGSRVRPAGYNAPELPLPGSSTASEQLSRLILGKTVELGAASKIEIDRGHLVCEVYFNGRNLADYFSRY